jgi:KDO2-lipid IV(A) lauroyltransferase
MIAYFLYKFARFLCMRLTPKGAYRLATFLSLVKYYISPRDRNAVIGNLKKILPSSELPRIRNYAREVFINFGKYLIEFFRFSLLKKEDYGHFIKIKGLEHIDKALKENKGIIVLSAHIGNWELGGVLMAMLGYPLFAVALPHRHNRVNAFFNAQRECLGMKVVPSLGVAVRRIFEALKTNHIVALVGDRDFANGGKKMPFLGDSKIIPKGPAVLSIRTGAAIIPGFVIRQAGDTHILEFSEPVPPSTNEDQILSVCTRIIEEKIRQYPGQWLMFREFWKE